MLLLLERPRRKVSLPSDTVSLTIEAETVLVEPASPALKTRACSLKV